MVILKKKKMLHFLKSKNYNIYCLQDTHFTSEIESSIFFFSSFSSNSKGVSILFNSNFEYEVLKEKRDLKGNYLALDVVIDKQKLTFLSLYGPNMDNPDFYDQIMNIIEDFGNERYLLCGDFNLVLCPHIDCYNYLHVNNPNARDKLIEIVDQCSLVDPFRELFPDLQRYTWRKKDTF